MQRALRKLIPGAMAIILLAGFALLMVYQHAIDGDTISDKTRHELGNTIIGIGSANWPYGNKRDFKCAFSFRARHTGEIASFVVCWKTAKGYGDGTFGSWWFELHPDNETTHLPAEAIISKLENYTPKEGYNRLPLPTAHLQEGMYYHLVMYNTDPQPDKNWSSPNTVISAEFKSWQGEGVLVFDRTAWKPWGQQAHGPQPARGCYAPYMLTYTDGITQGMPYYSATPCLIFADRFQGEQFTWRRPDVRIVEIGFYVGTVGKPAGPLQYTLEEKDGAGIAAGVVRTAAEGSETPTWSRVALAKPVTLRRGTAYRLYLYASQCSGEKNCYGTFVPYSSEEVSGWRALTWCGLDGSYTYHEDGKWKTPSIPADLIFSLQATE